MLLFRGGDYIRNIKKYTPTKFMSADSKYNKDAADFAVMFIEQLCHTKGMWAGKPFDLIDWQEQIVRDLFGILKPNGYRQFNTAYIEIAKKQGKQLSLDTLIPTPNGFTTMGDIAVGDSLFDDNGKICHVVAKSDVDYSEQAYRITFKDGAVVEAGARHQWAGEYTHGKRKSCIMTIALKQFRVGVIICTICGSFEYLIYPYSPAYIPSCYHFVISVDNSKGI